MSVHDTTEEGEPLLSLACSAGYYELAQVSFEGDFEFKVYVFFNSPQLLDGLGGAPTL